MHSGVAPREPEKGKQMHLEMVRVQLHIGAPSVSGSEKKSTRSALDLEYQLGKAGRSGGFEFPR